MTPRTTDPDIAVMVPASLARIIASGNAGSRDLDALETCVQCAIASDAVTVQLSRADADRLTNGAILFTSAERFRTDERDADDDDDHDAAADYRMDVEVLDRLADTIAAAVRQEGNE